MRVLFINENIGGHTTTALHLRRSLAEHPDVQARFLDLPARSGWRRLAGASIPGLGRLDLDLQPLRAQLAASAWTRRRLAALLPWAEVVHVFTHNAALLSADQLSRRPTVVALDGTGAQNAYRLPYRRPTRFTPVGVRMARPLEGRVYRAATLVVATTAAAELSLREEYGVAGDRVRRAFYGVAAPPADPAHAPGTALARPRLVFVGRSLSRKGGLQLLRVHQERLRDVCDLLLVTPESLPPLPGVQVESGISPGDPRLWELLRASSAFVFPSTIDQQPNAVMEAMAAGLPAVVHPIDAMAEMVQPGRTGLHLPDRSDDALAAAVTELIARPELRQRLGAAARQRWEERFSARATTAAVVAHLQEAADRFGRTG